MKYWLQFALLAIVIYFSARELVNSSEKIARQRGWGDVWTGFLLLAFATTLPELFTTISAVTVIAAPDLSFGNLLGSVMFNLFLVAVLDMAFKRSPIIQLPGKQLALLGYMCIILASISVSGILFDFHPGFFISPFSVMIIICYFAGSYAIYRAGLREIIQPDDITGSESTVVCWLKYAACAVVILIASIFLVRVVDNLAVLTGWGRTFLGTIFLAACTSLPEASTTFAAVKTGSYNMALGNILGANMMNLAIIFFVDVFYSRGSVFSAVLPQHAFTAMLGILITIILLLAVKYKLKKGANYIGWDSAAIAAVYLLGSYLLFYLRS